MVKFRLKVRNANYQLFEGNMSALKFHNKVFTNFSYVCTVESPLENSPALPYSVSRAHQAAEGGQYLLYSMVIS